MKRIQSNGDPSGGEAKADAPLTRVDGLSPAKRALLELRLKKGQKSPNDVTIQRRQQKNLVPVSYAQELLWLLDQLNPNLSVYGVPRAMRVKGPLQVEALKRVLNTIVTRHEVLRTTFAFRGDRPVQVIAEEATIDLRQVDLSSAESSLKDNEIQRLLTEEARRPYDLARDLMFRALLIKLSEDEHILYLGTHHIASDGWSKSVLFGELKELYLAYTEGRDSPLAELPIQYADYAIWQRQELEAEKYRSQLDYWKRQLDGAPAQLELPSDRRRPAIQAFRGSFVRVIFPKPLLDGLKALSQKEGATLFISLLAAFDVLIFRYTGQDDIVLGTPIAGRNRPELEGLIGYFTNTLALRSDLSGNPTFRELLARVRRMALAAYDHQDVPFEKLVVELKPVRNLSYSPVFQVLFSVGHVGAMSPDLPGLSTTPVLIDRGITKFDLTVGMTELVDGLAVVFDYSSDLFEQSTIHRMLDGFRVLLEEIVANPDGHISELSVLPSAIRDQILVTWNDTLAEMPAEQCIHTIISAKAKQTPHAIAVISDGKQLTYRELDRRANQLAHYLRKRGVGPEVLVGICVERSLEMAIGLMGILKAGGAFLPLDPSYPKDRLAYMLQDARVSLLLTQKSLRTQLSGQHLPIACLDSDWPAIALESESEPTVPATPDNPAYVIYTSGSTGKPRGVVVTHKGLVNHNYAAIKAYDLRPEDRVLQFAALSFDISIEEMFPTWVAGGTVVCRSAEMPLAGSQFIDWLKDNQVTVLNLPTAFWHEWVHDLSSLNKPLPDSLRLVVVGGEKAKASIFSTWCNLSGNRVRWINTYGPTEATVIATLCEAQPAKDPKGEISELPIGRPIANVQAYILDKWLHPVPIGVAGELYLAGAGVARGYLNQPGMTAERFIPNPFSHEMGARMYRTGDLARYRPDGNIEFLGRADEQVKIRGFRIEPGEIEAELGRHPQVHEVVVVARENRAGERQLVAYVVASGEIPPTRALQGHLRDRLPEYMVPAVFAVLPAIPKTPNGKVDRRALPEPSAAAGETESAFVAPRNHAEVHLAMLWENLLNVRRVSMTDNFFELGGHSLLAVRLLAQISQVFGKELPLATLFHTPTVEKLAELIRPDHDAFVWDTLIPIRPGGSRTPFFCAAAPNVNALGFVFLARHLGPDQPLYGLQSQYGGKRRQIYSREEYSAIAADYIAAMRKVQPIGPYYLGGTCEGSHIAFEMARQLIDANEEIGLLAMLDAWPLENSTSYFLVNYVHYNIRRFRMLLQNGMHRVKALVNQTRSALFGRFSKQQSVELPSQLLEPQTPPTAGQLPPAENWQNRLWPGKDFVPPTIPCRITVFRIRKQPYWRVRNEQLGWGPWTRGGVQVYVIPGRHNTILREPNVRVTAELLDECLRRAQNNTHRPADDRT